MAIQNHLRISGNSTTRKLDLRQFSAMFHRHSAHARSGITRKFARRAGGQARRPGSAKTLRRGDESAYAVLRNADFFRYLIGRFVASLGQQMLVVAIDWELYQRTHSALSLAFVGLSLMIPMILCTIPAGHIADIFNRKKIILVATLVLAVASVGLTLDFLLRRCRFIGFTSACSSSARRGRFCGRPARRS